MGRLADAVVAEAKARSGLDVERLGVVGHEADGTEWVSAAAPGG